MVIRKCLAGTGDLARRSRDWATVLPLAAAVCTHERGVGHDDPGGEVLGVKHAQAVVGVPVHELHICNSNANTCVSGHHQEK